MVAIHITTEFSLLGVTVTVLLSLRFLSCLATVENKQALKLMSKTVNHSLVFISCCVHVTNTRLFFVFISDDSSSFLASDD